MDLLLGILLSTTIGTLIILFALLAKLFGKKRQRKAQSLTLETPITLSLYEVEDLSLSDIIKEHAASAKHVVIDGEIGVQMNIQDYLNIMTQKVRQHDLEIADLVAQVVKPKRASRKKD